MNKNSESVRLALASMLHRCAEFIASLPAEDVDAMLDGEIDLRLSILSKKQRTKKKSGPPLDAARIADIASRLRSMGDRASGEMLLKEVAPTRAGLEAVARHLDVAVRRDDRHDDLLRRIIESTIGYRLASAAIQGRTNGRGRDQMSKPASAG